MDKNKNYLRTNLILTENKIESMSQTISSTELETEKKHRELEKEYSKYTNYAFNYISERTKNIKYADYVQRRITYEGWKYMIRLMDKLYKGDEDNG